MPPLASARGVCHFSRVRFHLAIPLLLALVSAGCSTPQEKAQRQEAARRTESSRTIEERRLRLVDGRDVASKRGAEIAVYDPDKTFDPSRSAVGGRTYNAGTARVKDFHYEQKANPGTYGTRDYGGTKKAWAGDMKYVARDAQMRGEYATKEARTKTAATKEAWDAGRTAATKDLRDGKREYLGPESKKLRQGLDPARMGDWRNGGESVVDTGNSVEKYSTMKTLSIDDIRELLNKNK